SEDGILTVKGTVSELASEQFLTVAICPVDSGSCILDDIIFIDQQLITSADFTLNYPIVLENGVYAARLGGNSITDPQYLIITKAGGTYSIQLGDVDGNGRIEAADATILLQYVLNKAAVILSPIQLKAANVTNSEKLSADDAAWILQKTLNGSILFPAEQENK
ncbi:MAG: dockerin type I repeat-containing protein, partial [Firmicutes bacterium]|nr:dockerin type I repeat-containing protein [Bacillota bacterium]